MLILDTFEITGRGTVILVKPVGWCPKMGDSVRVRQPSGLVIDARIRGIDMVSYRPDATEEQRARRGLLVNLPADGLVGCELLPEERT